MNEKVMGWLQVLGNFGLIAGLVLVGIQINQSSDIARAQMAHDGWLQASQTAMLQVGEDPVPILTKLFNGNHQLTDEELFAANAYYRHFKIEILRVEQANEIGLEIYPVEPAAEVFIPFFVEGFGRLWWNQNRNSLSLSAPNLTSRIDELLEIGNSTSLQSDLAELKIKLEGIE